MIEEQPVGDLEKVAEAFRDLGASRRICEEVHPELERNALDALRAGRIDSFMYGDASAHPAIAFALAE